MTSSQHLAEVVVELLVERVIARVEHQHRVLAVGQRLRDVEAEPLLVLRAHADDDEVIGSLRSSRARERALHDVAIAVARRDADEVVDDAEVRRHRDAAPRAQERAVRRRERAVERFLGRAIADSGTGPAIAHGILLVIQALANAFDELDGVRRHGVRRRLCTDASKKQSAEFVDDVARGNIGASRR